MSWKETGGAAYHVRDGGEHALVDAEEDGRNALAADGRLLEDALQTKIA